MNIIRCSYKIEFVTLRKTRVAALLLCFFLNDLLPQLDSPFPYIAGKARAAAALRESGRCPNPQKITTAAVATWTWRVFFLPKKGIFFFRYVMSCFKMFHYSFSIFIYIYFVVQSPPRNGLFQRLHSSNWLQERKKNNHAGHFCWYCRIL